MRARLADPELSLFVAIEGEQLAGFVACGSNRDPDPEHGVGEVQSLFVGPAGWRRGTGRALMAAAIADLGERGYEQATVWSFDANARANAFYEALGATFTELKVRRDPDCPICSREPESISDDEMGVFPDYEAFCAAAG